MRALREDQEHYEDKTAINKKYKYAMFVSNTVVGISGCFNFLNMLVFIMQSKKMGIRVFLNPWRLVDIIIIITNSITVANLFYKIGTRHVRLVECVLIFNLWFKCLYYMRLVNAISPLIESIFVIIQNMIYFLFIFVIGIIAFSEAFFVIGRNQVMFMEEANRAIDSHKPIEAPSYATIGGAVIDTYMSALG